MAWTLPTANIYTVQSLWFSSLFLFWGKYRENNKLPLSQKGIYAISFVNVDLLVYKVSSKAMQGAKELQSLEDEVCVTDVTGFEVKVSA